MSTLAISLVSDPELEDRLDRLVEAIGEAARVVSAAVVREKAVVKFYMAVRVINQRTGEFVDSLDESARQFQRGELELIDPDEVVHPQHVVDRMELLYRILDGLHVLATMVGLKKRMLTRGQVARLRSIADRLLDYIVWLRDAVTLEALERVEVSFTDGLRELEAGETVDFV